MLTVLLDIPSASEPSPGGGCNGELRATWWAGHNGHECGTATVVREMKDIYLTLYMLFVEQLLRCLG